jgi:hypothetical protein
MRIHRSEQGSTQQHKLFVKPWTYTFCEHLIESQFESIGKNKIVIISIVFRPTHKSKSGVGHCNIFQRAPPFAKINL